MTAPVVFAPGTRVAYIGSKVEWHGLATVVCRCHCRHCPWVERGELGTTDVRYEIEAEGGHTLLHVRPGSLIPEGSDPR